MAQEPLNSNPLSVQDRQELSDRHGISVLGSKPSKTGGMNAIYFGRYKGREVALKVALNPDYALRVRKEALSQKSMNQKDVRYVPEYLDYIELSGGCVVFVMEWLSGKTLSEMFRYGNSSNTKISIESRLVRKEWHAKMWALPANARMEACRIAVYGTAKCLAEIKIHDPKFAHADVKPGNIMVSDDWRGVSVIDFGISTGETLVVSAGTSPNAKPGTEGFKSPETREHGIRSPMADMYSVGKVMELCINFFKADDDPSDVWRPLEDLKTDLTRDNPEERPTAETVVRRIPPPEEVVEGFQSLVQLFVPDELSPADLLSEDHSHPSAAVRASSKMDVIADVYTNSSPVLPPPASTTASTQRSLSMSTAPHRDFFQPWAVVLLALTVGWVSHNGLKEAEVEANAMVKVAELNAKGEAAKAQWAGSTAARPSNLQSQLGTAKNAAEHSVESALGHAQSTQVASGGPIPSTERCGEPSTLAGSAQNSGGLGEDAQIATLRPPKSTPKKNVSNVPHVAPPATVQLAPTTGVVSEGEDIPSSGRGSEKMPAQAVAAAQPSPDPGGGSSLDKGVGSPSNVPDNSPGSGGGVASVVTFVPGVDINSPGKGGSEQVERRIFLLWIQGREKVVDIVPGKTVVKRPLAALRGVVKQKTSRVVKGKGVLIVRS